MDKTEFNITAQALGENATPIMITQSEYMRRMKEMANIQAGMSFYGEMPDMFNLVLNSDHKLVKEVLADEDSLTAVLVNLVKNAVEAFGTENLSDENGKYVKIKAEKRGEFAAIRIINNAGKINEPERIFEKGFTTKSGGSGLGLSICKKSIEEQLGQLKLEHTGDDYTEFLIKLGLVDGVRG